MKQEKLVYIGLGSNERRRKTQLERALRLVGALPGVRLIRVSPMVQSEPVGGPPQRDHFNGVAKLSVSLRPKQLLAELKKIEKRLGRKATGPKWGPRPIDLDILTYGKSRICQKNLVVPHPRYHQRRFVLVPFCRLAPHFVHPLLKRTNKALLRRLTPLGQRVTILARWKKDRFYPFKKRKSPANP